LTELKQAPPMYSNPITMATPVDSNSVKSASKRTFNQSGSEEDHSSQQISSEDEDDDDSGDDSDEESVLRRAGVELQLRELEGLDKAPLSLLTEVSHHGNLTVSTSLRSQLCRVATPSV